MDIIHAALEVIFVAACVFVKPALPNPSFPLSLTARGNEAFCTNGIPPPSCKRRFDQPPACGIVRITAWQFPDRMQVIGQQYDGDDFKRVAAIHVVNRFA
jgi:hypothetical protein